MVELLTAAQMRMIEKAAIDSGEVTGLELMERAGGGVVEAIYEEWPEFAPAERGAAPSSNIKRGPAPAPPEYLKKGEEAPRRAVVLCGPGNNGGDGFVVARLLHRDGWVVEVFLYGDPDKLPPDARTNYERWCEIGRVSSLKTFLLREGWGCDLLIDGLFGTGFRRPVPELGELFWNMEDMVDCFTVSPGHPIGRPAIVSIDLPSGLCSDSGKELMHGDHWNRFAASAHLTVTFHRPKVGHYLSDRAAQAGRLRIADIGLEEAQKALDWVSLLSAVSDDENEHLPTWRLAKTIMVRRVEATHPNWLSKGSDDHKFSHGHALILTGGAGKTGAARLAARGALRIGAGLVTLGVPQDARLEVASQITALMMCDVETEQDLSDVLMDTRINALCLGPGLGMDRARALVPLALTDPDRHVVLDADALSGFAENPDALFALLHENCVLTPHGGEFARLFPDIAEKLNALPASGPAFSKVDATRAAAKRAGCTVLFKGPDTVIATPDGSCAINAALYERAAPWLATAGSGDVLAGFITGLLARGMSPQSAAETAAWLHVECARTFGPGLIAEDLSEQLPIVFSQLIDQK
ncbi:NAD(P)H-hydrate dehydratase [Epibacterium sp. SM1969]|uniref:Bifunctional NAD(P)H-hydrate repair enzyme n=1 Tax=Tritonibacter aquimaris TaxID=2663379 RepID=A0A844AWP8_9RHOB|nr:NAD(P)H-hydrate dehydratase [Tritonibacter aquimaris]MQY44317.1 NAD(P)H-hydrate dehydratase [Tritonibacter aquimaris]